MDSKNRLRVYIHGVIWGIKISIKLMSRIKSISKGIIILCNIQRLLEDDTQFEGDNTKLWYAVEKIVCQYKY